MAQSYKGENPQGFETAVDFLKEAFTTLLPRIASQNAQGVFNKLHKKYPYLDAVGTEVSYVPTASDSDLIESVQKALDHSKFFREEFDQGFVDPTVDQSVDTADTCSKVFVALESFLVKRHAVALSYAEVGIALRSLPKSMFDTDTSVILLSFDVAGSDEDRATIKREFLSRYKTAKDDRAKYHSALASFRQNTNTLTTIESESQITLLSSRAFEKTATLNGKPVAVELQQQEKAYAAAVAKLVPLDSPTAPTQNPLPTPDSLEPDRRGASALSSWSVERELQCSLINRILDRIESFNVDTIHDKKQEVLSAQRSLQASYANLLPRDRPPVDDLPRTDIVLERLNERLETLRNAAETAREERIQNIRSMPPVTLPKLKGQSTYLEWRKGLSLNTHVNPLKRVRVLIDSIEHKETKVQIQGLTDEKQILEVIKRSFASESILVPALLRELRMMEPAKTMADFPRVAARIRNVFANVTSLGEAAVSHIDLTIINDVLSKLPMEAQHRWESHLLMLESGSLMNEPQGSERFSNEETPPASIIEDILPQELSADAKKTRTRFIRWLKSEEIIYSNIKTRQELCGQGSSTHPTPARSGNGQQSGARPRTGKPRERGQAYSAKGTRVCPVCKGDPGDHLDLKKNPTERLTGCETFRTMKPAERINLFGKLTGYCRSCLGPNCSSSACQKRTCRACKQPHHYMLCKQPKPPSGASAQAETSAALTARSDRAVRLTIGSAPISSPTDHKPSDAVIFIDGGSTDNFISHNFARKRKLKGTKVELDLTTLGHCGKRLQTWEYAVTVHLNNNTTRTIKAYEIPRLTVAKPHLADDLQKFSKFFGIKKAQINNASGEASLLIGARHLDLHPKLVKVKDGVGLYLSRLGLPYWLVGTTSTSTGVTQVNANFVDAHPRDFFANWATTDHLGLNTEPRCQAHLRAPACKACTKLSTPASFQEQQDLDIIRSHVDCDFVENKVTASLPFKRDPKETFTPATSNRQLAEKMALSLKKGLERDGQLQAYTDSFAEAVSRGVYREVPDTEIAEWDAAGNPHNYCSHHPVLKPGSTSPIRPVVNSSLPHRGTTLNDELLKGSNSINNLLHVMFRARQHPYFLIADVKKAYHTVRTPSQVDAHVRRLLWYRPEDLASDNPPLRHYVATTACFGDRVSANFLYVTVEKIAEWCAEQGPDWDSTRLTVLLNLYVDDILKSTCHLEEAEDLKSKIPEAFGMLGLSMKEILVVGPKLPLPPELPDTTTLLGYTYSYGNDTLYPRFKINFSPKRRSARLLPDITDVTELEKVVFTTSKLLSLQASQYDLQGLASPLLARGKILLSKCIKTTPNWKENLVPEHQAQALSYAKEILKLVQDPVTFRRCITPLGFSLTKLVGFVDASSVCLCVTIYAVNCRQPADGDNHPITDTVLVTSKSALCHRSVPDNELTALLAGNRLLHNFLHACDCPDLSEVVILSDSECSLAQIQPGYQARDVFTRNRVAEIHRLHSQLRVKQSYYHIGTASNTCADMGTRGSADADFLRTTEWRHGPSFITSLDSYPDASLSLVVDPSQALPTSAFEVEAHATSIKSSLPSSSQRPLIALLDRCSTVHKAVRVVAWVRRFLKLVRTHTFRGLRNVSRTQALASVNTLSNNELVLAFDALVSETQLAYPVDSLRTKQLITYVCPENGIIYTKQRCSDPVAEYLYSTLRLPVISPRSRLARLCAESAHLSALLNRGSAAHCTAIQTLVNSRTGRYGVYIVNGRQVVKGVIHRCVPCRKERLVPQEAIMGTRSFLGLPPPEDGAPWQFCSLDYFGPLPTKIPRSKDTRNTRVYKTWAMVVVCQSTLALNIVSVEGYSRLDFETAFGVHCANHGVPLKLTTDAMTAFVSAKEGADLDIHEYTSVFTGMGIDWKILPPGSQWKNGLSESVVKQVKRLTRFLGYHETAPALTPLEYQLLFSNIKELLNRRPIGYTVEDGTVTILSPNSFLFGRPSRHWTDIANLPTDPKARSNLVYDLTKSFWKRLQSDLASSSQLFKAPKWSSHGRPVKEGDVVLVIYASNLRDSYRIGLVTKVLDERTVNVKVSPPQTGNTHTFKSCKEMTLPIQRTCRLYTPPEVPPVDDCPDGQTKGPSGLVEVSSVE